MAALFFLYYSYQMLWSWWAAQPVVATTGMTMQQVTVGLLLYIVIPGLVWTPVSRDEFVTQVEQDQLVKRYEMQTKADIAILDAQLLRAQQLATVGWANLLGAEREELAGAVKGLVGGIDTTLQRIAGNLNEAATTVYGRHAGNTFSAPPLAEDLADILTYISGSITAREVREVPTPPTALVPAAPSPIELDERTRLLNERNEMRRRAERAEQALTTIQTVRARDQHDQAATEEPVPRVDSRSQSSESRAGQATTHDDTRRHTTTHDDAYLKAARKVFGETPWTIKSLAARLEIGETSAKGLRDAWLNERLVKEANLGRWYFTESEA
jgi:hypothetical protein